MKSTIIKILYPAWRLYKFLILRTLYEMRDTWFVWKLVNRESCLLQRNHPLPLDEHGEHVIKVMNEDGICITHIDDMFPGSTWLEVLEEYADSLKEHSFRNKRKTYWNEMWDVKNFVLDLSNPFLRLSLEPKMLAISNAYMDMYTRLHSIGLSETIPVVEGTPALQSQCWHRDIGNKKWFKVFLYLTDVEEDDGPFIYVKKSHPNGMWWRTFPQINPYTPEPGRVEDNNLALAIPQEDILHCTGKAGTLIFADTTGLHKGGYSIRNPRFASITAYYSKHTLVTKSSTCLVYPKNFDDQIKDLSPQAQFAIREL